MTTIGIVTPWKDHLELAPDYFAAVEPENPDQLVIVDDGSDPPLSFAATRRETSQGFCAASNAGLALIETDLVLMLNNDIAPLRQGWLQEVKDAIEPGVMVGPLRFDEHGNVDDNPYPYVDGWYCAMTTEDARRIGGWDEIYDKAGSAYYSDNALSLEARAKGMVLRELRPGVSHKGGVSLGEDRAIFEHSLAVNKEIFANRVREVVGG